MTGDRELRNLREVLRDAMVERDRIAEILREGPRTIPEIAEALHSPTDEVVKWVMAMRRYGQVHDLPKSRTEDYYQYALAEGGG
jgi:hypothetical protein